MSRALNVDASIADVVKVCAQQKVLISMIEPLSSGGTRVVLMNAVAAAGVAKAYGSKVMTGAVTRAPLRPSRSSQR